MPKSRPFIIFSSVLAALDFIAVYAGLSDMVGDKVAFFFILITKAVQVGVAFYSQSITVPSSDVAAYINKQGEAVAGPAGGPTNGTPVDVTAS